MSHQFAETMFTDSVKAEQAAYGSREHNAKLTENFGPNDKLSLKEELFIAERDSFYLATVNDQGWPYVQHRGGPLGFLKSLGTNLLAYADFRGNAQLVSSGNLKHNDRASIILMDYPNKRRLKILGNIRTENIDDVPPEVTSLVNLPDYGANIERVFFIDVHAFDWNCPQHITPRYTAQELERLSS